MKALSRAALVGTLATALAGLGLPLASLTALAGSAAPVFTSLTLTPNPSAEWQQIVLHGDFTDADGPEEHFLVVSWGGQVALTLQSIPAGALSFDVLKTYPDDRPTGTSFDTYDVVVTLYDGSAPDLSVPSTTQTLKHTVNDVAPDVHLDLSLTTILDGGSVSATLWFTDPGHPGLSTPNPCPASRTPDCFTEKVNWGDNSADAVWEQTVFSQLMTFAVPAHRFDVAGTYDVTATVTDDDGLTGTAKVTVVVGSKNTPPSGLKLSADVVSEGNATTLTGSFTDPDADDTHSVLINWGDGKDTAVPLGPGVLTFSAQHVYAVHDSYTAAVTVKDAGLATVSDNLAVLVRNTPPADLAMPAVTVIEGDEATLTGSFSDPDMLDTHSVRIEWRDGSTDSTVPLGAGTHTFSAKHVYAAQGSYKPTVTVTDLPANESVTGSADVTVLVRNTAPADLKLTVAEIDEGGTATLNGSFTDVDADDPHTVVVDWGDGSSKTTLSLTAGLTTFSAPHGYATAGTYTLGATVTDSHDAATSASVDLTVRAKTKSLSELLDALSALITSWNLDKGTENSLLTKVDAARPNVGTSDDKVCTSLNALGNEVNAQTGKKLSMEQVSDFWKLLAKVDAAVPCTAYGTAPNVRSSAHN